MTWTPRITPLEPSRHEVESERWECTRERLEPDWPPLVDEKGRRVHGYAVITETPQAMLGRVMRSTWGTTWTIGTLPFRVDVIATRDDEAFGAIPRGTAHATRELAIRYARAALAQQGKRYAKKFGSRS